MDPQHLLSYVWNTGRNAHFQMGYKNTTWVWFPPGTNHDKTTSNIREPLPLLCHQTVAAVKHEKNRNNKRYPDTPYDCPNRTLHEPTTKPAISSHFSYRWHAGRTSYFQTGCKSTS